jgi:penicillin-binding protein 2
MLNNREKYPTIEDAITVWKDYMVSMGFGYRLGVDLPGEARGMIPNATFYDNAYKNNWSALGVISIAIGQGEVTLTPLQIANLGATIANRGYYITPHVVKDIEGIGLPDSLKEKHYTKTKKEYYEVVAQGMRRAVLGGTCRGANTGMYEVCGKTGTAQNRGHDHSAFMGFAPMNNPKIAVAVYVENGGFGATYGVPIGALIIEQYIKGKLSAGSEKKAASIQARHILKNIPNYEEILKRERAEKKLSPEERELLEREKAEKERLEKEKKEKEEQEKAEKEKKEKEEKAKEEKAKKEAEKAEVKTDTKANKPNTPAPAGLGSAKANTPATTKSDSSKSEKEIPPATSTTPAVKQETEE